MLKKQGKNHCPGSLLRMTSGSGRGTSADHLTALNHRSYSSLSEAYCEPSIVLNTYHLLSHFILTIILGRRKYYYYFLNYYYLLSSDELQSRKLGWQQLHSLEQKHCPSRLDHWHSNLDWSAVIFAPSSGLTTSSLNLQLPACQWPVNILTQFFGRLKSLPKVAG